MEISTRHRAEGHKMPSQPQLHTYNCNNKERYGHFQVSVSGKQFEVYASGSVNLTRSAAHSSRLKTCASAEHFPENIVSTSGPSFAK